MLLILNGYLTSILANILASHSYIGDPVSTKATNILKSNSVVNILLIQDQQFLIEKCQLHIELDVEHLLLRYQPTNMCSGLSVVLYNFSFQYTHTTINSQQLLMY